MLTLQFSQDRINLFSTCGQTICIERTHGWRYSNDDPVELLNAYFSAHRVSGDHTFRSASKMGRLERQERSEILSKETFCYLRLFYLTKQHLPSDLALMLKCWVMIFWLTSALIVCFFFFLQQQVYPRKKQWPPMSRWWKSWRQILKVRRFCLNISSKNKQTKKTRFLPQIVPYGCALAVKLKLAND